MTNRNSTKEKLTEYIEKDAGVKLTEFHDQLKTFRADLSKQHVVSRSRMMQIRHKFQSMICLKL